MNKFRLTKVNIKEGKSSAVRDGKNTTGELLRKFLTEDGFDYVEDCSLSDIKIDDEISVNYKNPFSFLKTSPIESIEVKSPTILLLETGTSFYTLEELVND